MMVFHSFSELQQQVSVPVQPKTLFSYQLGVLPHLLSNHLFTSLNPQVVLGVLVAQLILLPIQQSELIQVELPLQLLVLPLKQFLPFSMELGTQYISKPLKITLQLPQLFS